MIYISEKSLPVHPSALAYYSDADSIFVGTEQSSNISTNELTGKSICGFCANPAAKKVYEYCFKHVTGAEDSYEFHCPECKKYTSVHYTRW